jgi:hypothetical protein
MSEWLYAYEIYVWRTVRKAHVNRNDVFFSHSYLAPMIYLSSHKNYPKYINNRQRQYFALRILTAVCFKDHMCART